MLISVDGITRALFCNSYATPSELKAMTHRELKYFYNALLEDAKARKADHA